MKIKEFYVIYSALAVCMVFAQSGRRKGYKEAIQSCNEYIDNLLANIKSQHEDLDPYRVNATTFTFQRKVIFVDFKGEARLNEGVISGFSSLRRESPCSLSFENDRYKLSADLQIDSLLFNFTGSVKIMNMGPEIFLNGNSSTVSIDMAFTVNSTSGREALLEDFKVKDIKDVTAWVGGLRFLNWINEAMKGSATLFFKSSVKHLVEITIREFVSERILQNPFSVEEFEIDASDFIANTQDEVPTTSIPEIDERPEGKKDYVKEDSDSYIDSVLENRYLFEADYSKLDPYALPDDRIDNAFLMGDKKKKNKDNNDNYLSLENGYLEDLSKVKRISDCTKPIWRSSNVTFVCYLGFNKIELKYDTKAYHENRVSHFELLGSILNTRISVKVTSNYKDNVPNMQNFNIHNLGQVTVKTAQVIADSRFFSDLPFNKETILKHFSSTLQRVLESRFKEVLSYSIYRTPIHFLS